MYDMLASSLLMPSFTLWPSGDERSTISVNSKMLLKSERRWEGRKGGRGEGWREGGRDGGRGGREEREEFHYPFGKEQNMKCISSRAGG